MHRKPGTKSQSTALSPVRIGPSTTCIAQLVECRLECCSVQHFIPARFGSRPLQRTSRRCRIHKKSEWTLPVILRIPLQSLALVCKRLNHICHERSLINFHMMFSLQKKIVFIMALEPSVNGMRARPDLACKCCILK